jgi:membrane protease YdiL (CAAX protease family)
LGCVKEMLPASTIASTWNKDVDHVLLNLISVTIVILIARNQQRKVEQRSVELNWTMVPPRIIITILLLTMAVFLLKICAVLGPMVFLKLDPEALAYDYPERSAVVLFVYNGLLVPIVEELLFRGIILEGMLKKYSPAKAIIMSSLFFGLMHFNPMHILTASVSGLFTGYVYYVSRSLYACVLMHMVNNLLSAVLETYEQELSALDSVPDLYWGIVSVVALAVCIAGVKRISRMKPTGEIVPAGVG